MNLKCSYFNILGMLGVVVFTIFTSTALAWYPIPYTPLYDWLSNLGNANLNPSGAIFFNWGCIITGLILIIFFLGLYRWNPIQKWSKVILMLAIILGIFASFSLIGVGIYPETNIHLHTLAASGVFGSLFPIVILIVIDLFEHPKFMPIVAYWGIITVLINLSFISILSLPQYNNALAGFHPTIPIPGLEWVTAFSSLIWIGLLSYNMWKKDI